MKKPIRIVLLGLAVALPGLASAQVQQKPCALIQQADVLRTYRRIKLDMEDKARNVKEMKNASGTEVDMFEQEYGQLRKEFNAFAAGFKDQIEEANGAPINLCDLNRNQLDDLMALYGNYEERFLQRYEDVMGTHETPLINSDFTQQVKNCQPKTAVVAPAVYKTQYEPELTVVTWGRL